MSISNKQWLGLPLNLLWGYIAVAVFMTGGGFELASLSHYIEALGFSPVEASSAFILYDLAAVLSTWISGVVVGIITLLKTMVVGFVLWCMFHVLFLVFGLGHASYALILVFYSIRGFAYPLFLYSFIVAIVHNVRSDSASSAIGWSWAVYSIGIGVFGSYIPSFTVLHIGELGTLWLALTFCVTGGVIVLASLRHIQTPQYMQNLTIRQRFSELGRIVTLLYINRNILPSSMVRIINTLSLFGFAVTMPMMFVDELSFATSEWFQVWAVFFFTTIFSDVLWEILGEKLGWVKVVRQFSCIGMAPSSLAFYYIPQRLDHNLAMVLIPAITLGIFAATFVPLAAVFPVLEPKRKGAVISVYNLSAGTSNFLVPTIAVVLLPFFSTIGAVIAYTTLYVVVFFLCASIRVERPGLSHKKATARKQAKFSQVVQLA